MILHPLSYGLNMNCLPRTVLGYQMGSLSCDGRVSVDLWSWYLISHSCLALWFTVIWGDPATMNWVACNAMPLKLTEPINQNKSFVFYCCFCWVCFQSTAKANQDTVHNKSPESVLLLSFPAVFPFSLPEVFNWRVHSTTMADASPKSKANCVISPSPFALMKPKMTAIYLEPAHP